MADLLISHAQELLIGVAKHRAQREVDLEEPTVEVLDRHTDRRVLERQPKALRPEARIGPPVPRGDAPTGTILAAEQTLLGLCPGRIGNPAGPHHLLFGGTAPHNERPPRIWG